ncbi:MAG: hypothetical protein A2Z12_01800 [Actinobacteria bacterium RBG_16_68_21]|nr:MAG: hypothetical protein A2Z12_01800 [Actinobacteria bacterium RBG_16_68_21]
MAKNDATPTDVADAASEAPASPWDGSGGIDSLAAEMLRNNRNDFLKAARSQRFAFATVKWLFLVIFLIALGALIAAVRIAIDVPESGYDWARAGVVATVAVMAIILFALLLYMRPLAALERNSVVQSFLTVVVNSYWTRLSFVKEAADIDAHLEGATAYTVEHLAALLDRQLLGSSKYLDVVRRAQDEAGEDTTAYRSPV